MTDYREILRLSSLGFSQNRIADSCNSSKKTVNKVLVAAREQELTWEVAQTLTSPELKKILFPERKHQISDGKQEPDYEYIRRELLKNGVSKKLLWNEYLEECRLKGTEPLMYSQFCHYIQQDEIRRRATMHIARKPGEQIEVDWAGDVARITDPVTGEAIKVYVFVGVLTYSQYIYAEAFTDQKQNSWIKAHVNMFEYFGGVSKILVPDNCKTAVIHNNGWFTQELNKVYREMAEHYGTAVIPARVRRPKDKASAESSVGHISTWIIAAIRNEQFFSLQELNIEIHKRLADINAAPFTKKEGSRLSLFLQEEKQCLTSLPTNRFELSEWKTATVQYNYHVSVDGMFYSVPNEYIKQKVDVRQTNTTIEIFSNHLRIATHKRLFGKSGQYSTQESHMPDSHRQFLEWDGKRFRKWAKNIGPNTQKVVEAILRSRKVEQQSYRSCMGLLKLAEKHSKEKLEAACERALTYTSSPSYKNVKDILLTSMDKSFPEKTKTKPNYGITRGAKYYGGHNND